MLRPVKERPHGPAEGARTGCAMPLRKQACRPIACRSCTGRVPLRCVLRPSRLPERTPSHHCGRLLGPSACFMTVWGLAKPDSSCIRHAEGVSARVLARGRSLAAPSNPSVHALLAMQLAAGEPELTPASRRAFCAEPSHRFRTAQERRAAAALGVCRSKSEHARTRRAAACV